MKWHNTGELLDKQGQHGMNPLTMMSSNSGLRSDANHCGKGLGSGPISGTCVVCIWATGPEVHIDCDPSSHGAHQQSSLLSPFDLVLRDRKHPSSIQYYDLMHWGPRCKILPQTFVRKSLETSQMTGNLLETG